MTTIRASRAVIGDHVVGPVEITIHDGLIAAIDHVDTTNDSLTLVPGFVDLQVNGIGKVDVSSAHGQDWDSLDAALLAQGTTTWCPTVISRPLHQYAPILEQVQRAADRGGLRPTIAGAHLEGPFLSVAGAHPSKHLRPPDQDWVAALPSIVRVVTLAPELDGALEAIGKLASAGVLVALGHTRAPLAVMEAAVEAGASMCTHLFNAMAPLDHRSPGPVGAGLMLDELAVSMVADLAHVHPLALGLLRRAKPPHRRVLVTDAVTSDREGSANHTPEGRLAGSNTGMDRAVRNLVRQCGYSVSEAVRAASRTPAELLGMHDRGRIEVGMRADLVALDTDLRAQQVWVAGEPAGPGGAHG